MSFAETLSNVCRDEATVGMHADMHPGPQIPWGGAAFPAGRLFGMSARGCTTIGELLLHHRGTAVGYVSQLAVQAVCLEGYCYASCTVFVSLPTCARVIRRPSILVCRAGAK